MVKWFLYIRWILLVLCIICLDGGEGRVNICRVMNITYKVINKLIIMNIENVYVDVYSINLYTTCVMVFIGPLLHIYILFYVAKYI